MLQNKLEYNPVYVLFPEKKVFTAKLDKYTIPDDEHNKVRKFIINRFADKCVDIFVLRDTLKDIVKKLAADIDIGSLEVCLRGIGSIRYQMIPILLKP